MWDQQTPRQIYELYNTYKDLHKEDNKPTSDGKVYSDNKAYNTVGRPRIPEWLKDKIPDGATVFNADVVSQEQMMSNN